MTNTVFYWRGSAEVRADLISALERRFNVLQYRQFEELLEEVERKKPVLIVVDASAGQAEASKRVVELSSAETLYLQPILFVAKQASRRSENLRKNFKRIHAVDIPYSLGEVFIRFSELTGIRFDHLEESSSEAESILGRTELKDGESKSELSSTALGEFGAQPDLDQGQPSPREEQFKRVKADDIRARLRSHRDPGNLFKSYGGKVFAIARTLEDFDDEILLPDHPSRETIKKALDFFGKQDEWLGLHARRVAFVAAAIANSLGFGAERDTNVRLVSLFLNWALVEGSRGLIRHDYIRTQNQEIRDSIANGFAQAAHAVRERFEDELAARTLRTASQLILSEQTDDDFEVVQDAQCAIVVDLASRSCWAEGSWNPMGAYRTFNSLRRERVAFLGDDEVISAMMRVLGEAVSTHVTVRNVYPSVFAEPGMSSGAAGDRIPGANGAAGVKVRLSDLVPGMRLVQPICTLDGKLILESNVRLDEETIVHLWQLCAIRAVNPAVEVDDKLSD